MINNTNEYILCAAIWYNDGISKDNELTFPAHHKGATFQNTNISTGFVIAQWRHGNIIAILPTNPSFNGGIKTCQGFLTSKGRFVDRWQGMYLALLSNQVDSKNAYNENWIEEHQEEYDNFNYEEFMNSVPSDNKFNTNPFNMLFSEDIY